MKNDFELHIGVTHCHETMRKAQIDRHNAFHEYHIDRDNDR